jgi:hypothetical protein
MVDIIQSVAIIVLSFAVLLNSQSIRDIASFRLSHRHSELLTLLIVIAGVVSSISLVAEFS